MGKSSAKLPLNRAIFWIFLSVFLISGSAWISFFIYSGFFNFRSSDTRFSIVALVQTGPEKEALNTSYLAELLELSIDKPKNLYQIDLKENQKKLLENSLFKSCFLKRIPPGTLYINYSIRKPYIFLADFRNTAVDQEGYLFPFAPFFSPKKLPSLYLGTLSSIKWGEKCPIESWTLAQEILQEGTRVAEFHGLDLTFVDLSGVFTESFGSRQIILTFEKRGQKIFVRLPSRNFSAAFKNFLLLDLEKFEKPTYTLDLRLENLAFYQ